MPKQSKDNIQLVFYEEGREYAAGTFFAIPNMAAFVRDTTEYGNMGAVIRRAMKLSPANLIKLGLWNILGVMKLAKKDFSSGLALLIQIEILKIAKYKPKMMVLTDQVTDLSVALDREKIITSFLHAAKTMKIDSGIMTNNIVQTRELAGNLGLKRLTIVLPFNSFGYEMNPSQKETEQTVRLMDTRFIYAIVPADDKNQDEYLRKFEITKKVTKWF